MILSTLLCLTALQSPWDDAMQRELSLHEIADLIDPAAAVSEALTRELLRNALTLSLTNPNEETERSDQVLQSIALLALEADHGNSQQDMTEEIIGTDQLYWSALFGEIDIPVQYRFDSNQQFITVLKTFMDPPYVDSGASLKIKQVDGDALLLGYLSQAQDSWLREFLRLQREEIGWQGLVDVTVLRGDTSGTDSLDPNERLVMLYGEQEVEDLKAAYMALGMDVLSAPSMLVLPAQEGKLSVTNQVSYVSNWTLETIEPGAQVIADPSVEVMEEGLELKFRVWQLDLNGFGIEVGIDYSAVERPIEVSTITIENGGHKQQLEVSNPDLMTTSLEAAVRMPDGSGLQMFAPSDHEGMDIVILLTFRQVDIDNGD